MEEKLFYLKPKCPECGQSLFFDYEIEKLCCDCCYQRYETMLFESESLSACYN
jgi:NMD protein affecting ribosome stability and mRNA decay